MFRAPCCETTTQFTMFDSMNATLFEYEPNEVRMLMELGKWDFSSSSRPHTLDAKLHMPASFESVADALAANLGQLLCGETYSEAAQALEEANMGLSPTRGCEQLGEWNSLQATGTDTVTKHMTEQQVQHFRENISQWMGNGFINGQ